MRAADKRARVTEIKDLALVVVRESGVWDRTGSYRDLTARRGELTIGYRTPFQKLPAISPQLAYMRAVLKGKENLPYGLDIWHQSKKVLNVEWSDDGEFEIISYKPGEWEWQLRPDNSEPTTGSFVRAS